MIAKVALPLPIAKTFSYFVPEDKKPVIKPFQRVIVPFRYRSYLGFVIETMDTCEEGLKEISEIVDLYPLIDEPIKKLCLWASSYYITPIGLVFKYALPKYIRLEKNLLIEKREDCACEELINIKGNTLDRIISTIEPKKILEHIESEKIILCDRFTKQRFSPEYNLNNNQNLKQKHNIEKVLFIGDIKKRIEYYICSIEEQLKNNKNVLMLLPDYDLSGKFFYEVLRERFGEKVFWYGSSIKQALRMETFFKARAETGNIIMGNKTCVFLPISNLSLIIVERHEEDSFRNEKEFKFNAWEVGIKRAEIENVSIIFGSIAPKIEIYHKVETKEFKVIEEGIPILTNSFEKRINKKIFFSNKIPEQLSEIIKERLINKKSVGVFLPRKHYSAQMQCITCGYTFVCLSCNSILNYKKKGNETICPNCQKHSHYKEICPQCKSTFIRFYQFGAEYIEEKIKERFGDIDIVLLTGDYILESIEKFIDEKIDKKIIVGTYILSKLYRIYCDTLIFICPEDILNMAGYRAEEKLFQIVFNTVDALTPHEVYFFIDEKKDFKIERFKDYKGFYKDELEKRRLAEFPPFNNIYLIEIEKKSIKAGEKALKIIIDKIKASGLIKNMKGPLFEKRKRYKWKIIIKDNNENMKDFLFSLYDIQNISIEVNPLNI